MGVFLTKKGVSEGTELEKDPLAEEMPQVQLVVHVAKPTFGGTFSRGISLL